MSDDFEFVLDEEEFEAKQSVSEMMQELEELIAQEEILKEKIAAILLEREESASFGRVKARFSSGRRTYDYQSAAIAAEVPEDIITANTTTRETVSWKSVCEAAGIPMEDIVYEEAPAKVSFKFE